MILFWKLLILLLGIILLICGGWLWVIRQQEPAWRMLIQSNQSGSDDFYITELDGTVRYLIPNEIQAGLYLVAMEGSRLFYGDGVTLISVRWDGSGHRTLSQSPVRGYIPVLRISEDHRWLALIGNNAGERHLMVMPLDRQQQPTLLSTDVNWSYDFRVVWSPDSEWLIYNSPGTSDIYRIRRAGGTPERIADGELVWYRLIEERWILAQNDGLLLLNPDGSLYRTLFPQAQYSQIRIVWLFPDTNWMAVTAIIGDQQEVYRVALDGSGSSRLFQLPTADMINAISPDGSTLIATNAEDNVYRLTSAQPEPKPLILPSSEIIYTFWGKEQTAYFHFMNNNTSGLGFDVARLAPDETTAERLTNRDQGVVSFSPDSNYAIWMQSAPDRRSSYLVRETVATGERLSLTDPSDNAHFMGWLPQIDLEVRWLPILGGGLLLSVIGSVGVGFKDVVAIIAMRSNRDRHP